MELWVLRWGDDPGCLDASSVVTRVFMKGKVSKEKLDDSEGRGAAGHLKREEGTTATLQAPEGALTSRTTQ